MFITKADRQSWGSRYTERKDSYDDEQDIINFVQRVHNDPKLLQHLRGYSNGKLIKFKKHPWGQYDVDMGMYDANDNLLAILEMERRWMWKNEFLYDTISFLDRKGHYLNRDIPFIMVWTDRDNKKYLLLDGEAIKKYQPFKKLFKKYNRYDMIREINSSEAYIFGDNLTQRDKQLFNN